MHRRPSKFGTPGFGYRTVPVSAAVPDVVPDVFP
jgi:hypothetical protein